MQNNMYIYFSFTRTLAAQSFEFTFPNFCIQRSRRGQSFCAWNALFHHRCLFPCPFFFFSSLLLNSSPDSYALWSPHHLSHNRHHHRRRPKSAMFSLLLFLNCCSLRSRCFPPHLVSALSLYFSIFFCFKTVNALFNCRILMGKSLSALHSNSSLFIPKEFYSSEWRDLSKRKVNALSPSLFNITVSLETQMENDRSVELKVSLAGFHIFGLIEVHSMN